MSSAASDIAAHPLPLGTASRRRRSPCGGRCNSWACRQCKWCRAGGLSANTAIFEFASDVANLAVIVALLKDVRVDTTAWD